MPGAQFVGRRRLRAAALILAVLVTLFWLWFGVASAASEQLGWPNWIAHLLVPGGILLVTLFIAWKWPAVGGTLFLAEGLIVAVGYPIFARGRTLPIVTVVTMLLTLAAPLAVAGVMLLRSSRPGAPAGSPGASPP